jgi:hypothetical protein
MSISSIGNSAVMGGYLPRNVGRSAALPPPSGDNAPSVGDSPEEAFLKFAKMSPAEKIRYLFLQEHGLTEDDLKAMSPADREAIEAKIRERIKEAMKQSTEKKTGLIADVRA